MTSSDIIATTELICIRPTGERVNCRVEIGKPYRAESGEWVCHLSLGELYERRPDICGEDSLQALCLALSLARQLLAHFAENGGRVLISGTETDSEETNCDFPIDAWFSRVGL